MTVVPFPRPANAQLDGGITHEQAAEVFRRFCEQGQAAPTIAHVMSVPYESVCQLLGGAIFSDLWRHWCNRVMP
ncbi:hypothetical protein [Variovorax sp. RCC_210]|uniref:hypothetical protein n=1 Tax=Variovorax sp. RCC_210 TaxID=3239217 RepID=UPI0035266B38